MDLELRARGLVTHCQDIDVEARGTVLAEDHGDQQDPAVIETDTKLAAVRADLHVANRAIVELRHSLGDTPQILDRCHCGSWHFG